MSDPKQREGGISVLARGMRRNPEITEGIWVTLLLALISTAGGSLVPIVVRAALDDGFAAGDVDTGLVTRYVAIAAVLMVGIAIAGYWSKVRIFTASERGLANLRVAAFRHVHDLSMLTQNTQRRGSLVSRVTSDVDQISQFLQFTGIMMIISVGQMIVATIVMAFLSWQLTLVVLISFVPLALSLRWLAGAMSRAYDHVRASVGEMLAVIAEPVVGASVVRSYGIEDRTQQRVDVAVRANYRNNIRAQTITAGAFSAAILVGGIANAAVLAIGVWLGVLGDLSVGTIVAFVFLVGLFTGPAQMATQVISEAQNAISSWRRVLDLLDTPADVVDPGAEAEPLPAGDLEARFEKVSFAYPEGPTVLAGVDVTIEARQRVAVVGETGSGKTTFAKLLTRLMDPVEGRVVLGGVDISRVAFEDLRRHVLMVPQEGFLFDATLGENLRYGARDATDADLVSAVERLGLADWFAALPRGLETRVGQRGESLSAGERQLVALVRSALADPALLVLDEATSAVDPQTELRATRALDRLLEGRTSVTIAHRLSTAENADRVLVFDQGRLVEDGHHRDLVSAGGVYARLHASWVAQATLA
ncbi:ABC transporter ATP-binding protein [Aeromicrobium tamlense]|uniref:ABC transporter ATP-binding protein n=1 Tax=Aeromicrobium tamlense TaxID=375541 RepID=A0A8I0G2A5_9ACTN|nr:ABC transporter ATP-binding protein [Aeromicrobium tamlense]MBD1271609.1 ABC transporter ATP-binding protein [Aeromicrobium tamlense]NYI37645.1 ABC-type multidrug transport system fused ATPase/permease subunit [Aeromicrobium tamlense]